MKLPTGKSRLDMVRSGEATDTSPNRGRRVVKLDKLREDPENERKTFRNMDEFIKSVQHMGIVEPLTVTPDETGESYIILTGARRFRAAKELGHKDIEVIVRDPDEHRVRRMKSIISNVQREDIGPIEMARALQKLLEEDTDINNQQELGDKIGKDKTWVSQMLRVLQMPPHLLEKVETSQQAIPYDSIIKIARIEDTQKQEELTDALLSGATIREIRDQVNEFKGKGKKTGNSEKGQTTETKPKEVFHTSQNMSVIVQSKTKRDKASSDEIVGALEEALKQARGS